MLCHCLEAYLDTRIGDGYVPPKPHSGRENWLCVPVWPRRAMSEFSIPPMILALNLICAVTWDSLQGHLAAGSKTKIYLIICAWVIYQGNAPSVRQHRNGLFRVAQCIQVWEGARSQEPSKVTMPPYQRRCQADLKSHLQQTVSSAFSLVWAKRRKFSRTFFFFSLSLKGQKQCSDVI